MPATVVALRVTYDAPELLASEPTSAAAVAQGQRRRARGRAVRGGRGGGALPAPARGRPHHAAPAAPAPRPVAGVVAVASLVAVAVAFVSVGAPDFVQRQYDLFVSRSAVRDTGDVRDRLTDPASSGRIDFWRVGMRAYRG